MKPYPCFCLDCIYSKYEKPDSTYWLRCFNPKVNAKEAHSLGSGNGIEEGVSCRDERDKKWFGACGMSGKLWEKK